MQRFQDVDYALPVSAALDGNGLLKPFGQCHLATYPIETIVKKFRPELEEAIRNQPSGRVEEVLRVLN